MATVVLDIETAGHSWDSLDDAQKTYLAKERAHRRGARTAPGDALPLAADRKDHRHRDAESRHGPRAHLVRERPTGALEETSADGRFKFVGDAEPAILAEFWKAMRRFQRFVTFNGRGFDGPFLMLRSAVLGIPPTRNLVGYRYALRPHTDLLEAITFFGASRKWNLDFACKAFGVESPKEHGMDGFSVGPFYRAGRIREIAEYCRRDVEATAGLFRKLEKTLLPALENR